LHLLVDRGNGYFDFVKEVSARSDLTRLIEADEGVVLKEQALREAVDSWWTEHQIGISNLRQGLQLMQLRADLLSSFQNAARPVELLDRFRVAGVIASWWGDTQNDLKTIAARGFAGLGASWEASILNGLDDKVGRETAIDHKLVKRLLPEYVAGIEELQAKTADLEATIKAGSGGNDEDDGEEVAAELSDEELIATKRELAATRKQLKGLQRDFVVKLQKARSELDERSARELVIGILEAELRAILDRYIAHERELVGLAFEIWWDKYRVTLSSIAAEREEATAKLQSFLEGLAYGV